MIVCSRECRKEDFMDMEEKGRSYLQFTKVVKGQMKILNVLLMLTVK